MMDIKGEIMEMEVDANVDFQFFKKQTPIIGLRKDFIEFKIYFSIWLITLKNFIPFFKGIKILKNLRDIRRSITGQHKILKTVKVDGRFFWDLYTPGYPSKTLEMFFEGEINRQSPLPQKGNRFTNAFMAITKKCPLNCEHCFEWDNLNKKEVLTLSQLKDMVKIIQEKGSSQIQFTGGEPTLRTKDIIDIIKDSKKTTDFWLLTSGYNFTNDNAKNLKAAGLTGVVISLDHFDPNMHDAFRGFTNSFNWVVEAVKNTLENNLVCALSICVTKAFVSEENLLAYMELAKKLGVSFVQIVEPKPVGHYKDQDVLLKEQHIKILTDFYLKINFDKKFASYPIVSYHGFYQRVTGCFASGNRNLYIDTDGDLHACPFCQTKMGNVLNDNFDACLEKLVKKGCHTFPNAKH